MKKFILCSIMLLAFGFMASAQNVFTLQLGENICVDQIGVTYTDYTSTTYNVGCSGTYEFSEGSDVILYITVNGTDCYNDATTLVTVNGNAHASVTLKKKVIQTSQTNIDGVITLIR